MFSINIKSFASSLCIQQGINQIKSRRVNTRRRKRIKDMKEKEEEGEGECQRQPCVWQGCAIKHPRKQNAKSAIKPKGNSILSGGSQQSGTLIAN